MAERCVQRRRQDLRQRRPGRVRPLARCARRRVPRPGRAVRVRQDDHAAHGRRARGRSRRRRSRSAAASSTTLAPSERDIAMVFQNYALYPHMTVAREHRLRAADRARSPKTRSTSASREAAEMLGSTPYLDRKPQAALGRAAPARRDRPRDRARAAGRS